MIFIVKTVLSTICNVQFFFTLLSPFTCACTVHPFTVYPPKLNEFSVWINLHLYLRFFGFTQFHFCQPAIFWKKSVSYKHKTTLFNGCVGASISHPKKLKSEKVKKFVIFSLFTHTKTLCIFARLSLLFTLSCYCLLIYVRCLPNIFWWLILM